jgi:hypothetical protein
MTCPQIPGCSMLMKHGSGRCLWWCWVGFLCWVIICASIMPYDIHLLCALSWGLVDHVHHYGPLRRIQTVQVRDRVLWGFHQARSWLLKLYLGQDTWGQGASPWIKYNSNTMSWSTHSRVLPPGRWVAPKPPCFVKALMRRLVASVRTGLSAWNWGLLCMGEAPEETSGK